MNWLSGFATVRLADRQLHTLAVAATTLAFMSGCAIYIVAGVGILLTIVSMLRSPLGIAMLILSVAAIFIPFLVPFAFIAMVWMALRRWAFFLEHAAAIGTGLGVYAAAGAGTALAADLLGSLATPLLITLQVVVGLAAGWGIDRIFAHFYGRGYRTQPLIEVMTMAPIIVILLFLPLFKFFMDISMDAAVDHAGFDNGGIDHGGIDHGGTHHGAFDKPAGNQEVYVHKHVRTSPDGLPENNLSYHGPGARPDPASVEVDGYWRAAPGHASAAPDAAHAASHGFETSGDNAGHTGGGHSADGGPSRSVPSFASTEERRTRRP